MINVSNAFKNELYLDHRSYLEYADITLSDGTELNLTNKDFWQGGMSLDDAVSGNDAFEIGAAIVNSCSLTIENLDDRFSEYDFLNAEIVIYVGLNLPDGTTEKIRKGTYTVNEPKYNGATISLNCQDYMAKFDRSYSESELTYPATLNQIVRDACSTCDVTLQTLTFSHSDFVVQTRPTDEAITFREIISWAAQIAGCFCRCDVYGRLELKWYDQQLLEKHGYDGGIFDKLDTAKYTTGDDVDGGSFNPWDTGDTADGGTFEEMEGIHHIYSHYSAPVISTDDVVITGVRVLEKAKEQDEETGSEKDAIITYQSGTDGYVVSIEDNELIQGGAGLQISNWLGEQLIGFRFRKASLSHASDPTIEAGDVAIVTDRKQNTYPIIISSTRFSTGSAQSTESSAETPARNSAARFSAQTKNYVEYRKGIQKERTEREKAQEELKERIDGSSGLYTTEQTQPDGSTIFYMHDKPTLDESKIVWKMTAEAWGVSTDGGDTYNAGMTVDGDVIARILTATGINADWIKTGAFRIEKDGRVIFLADANTKQVKIVADEFSLSSGDTIDSIAEEKANEAAEDALTSAKGYTDTSVNDFVSKTYNPKVAELQKQLDGQIESFYYDYAPTTSNVPASAWTTEADKQKHEGDLFFNKTTGLAYRFFKDTSGWTWQLIRDNDVSKAIADAAAAQDTADHKRRVFVSQPMPPYDVGDLWVQGENGDILRCQTARPSGAYVSGDWVKASKYTDDSALTAFIKGDFATLSAQADKKAETFYQTTDPSGSWTSAEKTEHTGDLWYNSTKNVQKYYRWNGTGWQELTSTPPDAVFNQINGKAQIFISQPVPPYQQGDLWFNSNTSDIMTCITSRESGDYVASDWQKRNKYIDQSAANKAATDAVNGQTQESIFNKLTENGTKKTFRMEKGEIYLNATYIQSGALKVAKGEKTLFLADIDTGKVEIVADKFSLSSGETIETIAENKANTAAGGALESAKNYADTASKNAVDKQTQEDIFNKLTNNGETQGIYIQDGKVYINADYIQSGTFSAARIKGGTLTLGGSSNTNGSLRILNSSGAEVGSWNNSGLKAIAGTIGPWTIADTAIYNGIEFRGNKNTKSTGVGTYGSNWAFWAGDGRFTVDQDGNMRAENGVFGGSLDAATGTFSGSLSAAGGSFNGDISAASGTFTGKVKSSGSYGDVVIGNGYLNAGEVLQIGIVGDIIPGYLNEPDPLGEPSIARVTHSAPMLRYISGNNSFIVVGNSMYVELKTGYNMTFYTNLEVRGNLEVKGNLSVRGTKPRLVETDDYEDRLLYCYETPSPLFGDIGEAITDENGECYIYLDDIFSETVSAQIEYQVFLQKEGPGDIWIAEKTPQYFVVQGTENLKFAWEIKAKQRDYEYERLEKYQENEAEEIDYEQQYLDEIEMLIKEQEEIYYETA